MDRSFQISHPFSWLNRKVLRHLSGARAPLLILVVVVVGLFLLVSLQTFLIYGVYQSGIVEDVAALELTLERSLHQYIYENWISKTDTAFAAAWIVLFLILCGMIVSLLRSTPASSSPHMSHGGELEGDLKARPEDKGRWASRLAAADQELQRRDALVSLQRKSFDALLSISEAAGENPCLDTIYRCALEAMRSATGFDSIGIRTYDRDHHSFNLVAHYGISPEMLKILQRIPEDCGFQADAYQKKWPVFTSDILADPRVSGRIQPEIRYRSLICVPLIAGDQILGTMELVTEQVYSWTEDEVRWLALFGRSLGTLIRNVELTNRLRDSSVLQERSRLAQEIHDGLAQLVGSLPLWADEAQNCLQDGDVVSAEAALDKMEHTARDAYAYIREELLGLRAAIAPGDDLLPVMSEYLSRFQRQWGIETELVDERSSSEKLGSLDPRAGIQLLRIFQESLSNVRRHSRATRVRVSVGQMNGRLCISVQDNGTGFDPEAVSDERLGLRIMRERAESVGGTIRIASHVGCGTQLQIELPGQG